VVGGGVAGYTTCIALAKRLKGVSLTLYEQREGPADEAAGAALNMNGGATVLCDLGLESELRAVGNPMRRVFGRTTYGLELLDVDIAKACAAVPSLVRGGASTAVTLLRSELLALLSSAVAKLPAAQFRARTGTAVQRVLPDGRLSLADGSVSEESFDLVVGCDGIRSALRAAHLTSRPPVYSGIRIAFAVAPRWQAGKATGLRGAGVAETEVHQHFGPGSYALAYTAGGAASSGGGHCLALCWQESAPSAEEAGWPAAPLEQSRAELLARLQQGGYPGQLSVLVSAATRIFSIAVHHHAPLDSPWSCRVGGAAEGPRLVLLGDSAHAMPPFLGQGANQAVQDAECLARLLGERAEGSSLDAALTAYEALRRPPTAALQTTSWGIGLLDTLPAPFHPLRDAALWGAGHLGIAQQVFIAGATPRT